MKTKHPATGTIRRFLSGTTSDEESFQVADHLDGCGECARLVEVLGFLGDSEWFDRLWDSWTAEEHLFSLEKERWERVTWAGPAPAPAGEPEPSWVRKAVDGFRLLGSLGELVSTRILVDGRQHLAMIGSGDSAAGVGFQLALQPAGIAGPEGDSPEPDLKEAGAALSQGRIAEALAGLRRAREKHALRPSVAEGKILRNGKEEAMVYVNARTGCLSVRWLGSERPDYALFLPRDPERPPVVSRFSSDSTGCWTTDVFNIPDGLAEVFLLPGKKPEKG